MKAMTLRLPDEVHERLRRQAFEKRTSVNALVLAAIDGQSGLLHADMARLIRAAADDLFTWMTSTDEDTGPEQINAWLGEQADKIEQPGGGK